MALVILPARMHEVHTWTLRGEPFTIALTLWMFGFQRRLVRRWEWLMLIPNDGRFPHTSHTAAIATAPHWIGATTPDRPGGEAEPRPREVGGGQAIRAGRPG